MAIPRTHQRQLQEVLSELESAVKLHAVLSNKALTRAIGRLRTNARARAEAERNVGAFLTKQGVRLPKDVTVRFKPNNWCVEIGVGVYHHGLRHYLGVHYNSGSGWGWGGCG